MAAEFCILHAGKVLLHAVIYDTEVVLRMFIALKNPSTSAGIEHANH
jgi:hypothetical protein